MHKWFPGMVVLRNPTCGFHSFLDPLNNHLLKHGRKYASFKRRKPVLKMYVYFARREMSKVLVMEKLAGNYLMFLGI